jgi:hypothetical protein
MKVEWTIAVILVGGLLLMGPGVPFCAVDEPVNLYADSSESGESLEGGGRGLAFVSNLEILQIDRGGSGASSILKVFVNPELKHYETPIERCEFKDSEGQLYSLSDSPMLTSDAGPYYLFEAPRLLPPGNLVFTMYDADGASYELNSRDLNTLPHRALKGEEHSPPEAQLAGNGPTGDFSGTNSQGYPFDFAISYTYITISENKPFKVSFNGPYCSNLTATTYGSVPLSYGGKSFQFGSSFGDGFQVSGTFNAKSDRWEGDWNYKNSRCGVSGSGKWSAGRFYPPVDVEGLLPSEGTIGTQPGMTGSGFGASRGKILIGTTKAKILQWSTASVEWLMSKPPLPGVYDLTIAPKEPKGVTPTVLPAYFTVKGPEITSLSKNSGFVGEQITISGKFFGTKKGKVLLTDGSGKAFKCKVLSWVMDPKTNAGSIVFAVPKKVYGVCDVTVMNKIGSVAVTDAFTVQ